MNIYERMPNEMRSSAIYDIVERCVSVRKHRAMPMSMNTENDWFTTSVTLVVTGCASKQMPAMGYLQLLKDLLVDLRSNSGHW